MCMLRGNCLIGSNSSSSITKKVAQYMGDVLEEQKHKLEDNLAVNGRMFYFLFLYPQFLLPRSSPNSSGIMLNIPSNKR